MAVDEQDRHGHSWLPSHQPVTDNTAIYVGHTLISIQIRLLSTSFLHIFPSGKIKKLMSTR